MTEQTKRRPVASREALRRETLQEPDGSLYEWHERDCGSEYGDKPHWHFAGYAPVMPSDPEEARRASTVASDGEQCMIYRTPSRG